MLEGGVSGPNWYSKLAKLTPNDPKGEREKEREREKENKGIKGRKQERTETYQRQ